MLVRDFVGALFVAAALFATEPVSSHKVSEADVNRWMTELSNWGRWGKNDQIGTVHLITPEKRKQAASLVKDGISISLSHTAETEKAIDNPSPFRHTMLSTGARPEGQFVLDEYSVSFHGYAHTHMDALCHMAWRGKMFNGISTNGRDGKRGERTPCHRIRERYFHAGCSD